MTTTNASVRAEAPAEGGGPQVATTAATLLGWFFLGAGVMRLRHEVAR